MIGEKIYLDFHESVMYDKNVTYIKFVSKIKKLKEVL